jgi:hypothetical protein
MTNVAAYVDQVSDDPIKAVDVCKQLGIGYLVVSKLWSTDVNNCKDELLQSFRKKCADAGIDIIAIETVEHTNRTSLIANYLKANKVIYQKSPNPDAIIESVQHDFVPLVYYRRNDEKNSSRVKYYYDPTMIGSNHFENDWPKVKDQVVAVSVNDQTPRVGARAFGVGENQLKQLLPAAADKWMMLKPNLGRRIGSLDSKEAIFASNFNVFKNLIGG